MSIQRPSCFFNLCSSCSSCSNKHRRDCLLPHPHGRLCCRAGLTAPPYSHRCPSHPSTHPHLLLFSGDGRRTSKPLYCPPHGKQLSSLPCLCGVPFLGLAVVHRGQRGQGTTSIGRGLYMERLTAGSTPHQGSASLLHRK